jgi:hypothetical protein
MSSVCTIQRRHRKQKLSYSSGSGTPAVGQTVSGATSHHTAEITRVSTGYIVVKTVSGAFTIGETISTTTFSGTISDQADYQNQSKEFEHYWSDDHPSVPCRFGYAGDKNSGLMIHETGQLLDLPLKVALPDSITFVGTQAEWAENYRIVSTVPGFKGTFQILTPYVVNGISGIDHYSFVLKAVP